MKGLNIGTSISAGQLDDEDAAFLTKHFPDVYDGSQDSRRWGIDATYNCAPLYGTFEYYDGTFGNIPLHGWTVLVGWQDIRNSAGKWRDFSPGYKGLYARYTRLSIGVPETLDLDTWNTQQFGLSYVIPLHAAPFTACRGGCSLSTSTTRRRLSRAPTRSPTTCSSPSCGALSDRDSGFATAWNSSGGAGSCSAKPDKTCDAHPNGGRCQGVRISG